LEQGSKAPAILAAREVLIAAADSRAGYCAQKELREYCCFASNQRRRIASLLRSEAKDSDPKLGAYPGVEACQAVGWG
jgi:hypothetical protein